MTKRICVLAALLSLALCACSAENEESVGISGIKDMVETIDAAENDAQTEASVVVSVEDNEIESKEPETVVQETLEKESAMQETVTPDNVAEYDVQAKLSEAEEKAAALEKKLYEDSSLSQADMNDLSYEIYTVWDDTLNSIWQALNDSLDKDTMDALLEEQRTWITEKEKEVKQTGEAAGGGSLAPLVSNQRAAKLTETRVYELAAYLGYVGTSSENDNSAEKTGEDPYQEVETTITFMVEGKEEEVPATVFEGKDYTISIPTDGWEMYATEAWMSNVNNEVQFWITDYAGEDVDIVCGKLSGSGYVASENDPHLLSYEDNDAAVWNVKLFTEDEKVIGVFYYYPSEAAEGFGTRLATIVNTFTWK